MEDHLCQFLVLLKVDRECLDESLSIPKLIILSSKVDRKFTENALMGLCKFSVNDCQIEAMYTICKILFPKRRFLLQKKTGLFLNRLLPRINSFDPVFFLRSDYVLKFRIFWSVLVTAYYINP